MISRFTHHSYRWSLLVCLLIAAVGALVLTNVVASRDERPKLNLKTVEKQPSSAGPVQSQPQQATTEAPTTPEPTAMPSDPHILEALKQIQAKLDTIQSYQYTLHCTDAFDQKGTIREKEGRVEIRFKRPYFYKSCGVQTKHPIDAMSGTTDENVIDGKTWYGYSKRPAGSGQKMLEQTKGRRSDTPEEFIRKFETTTGSQKDFQKLLQAGMTDDELASLTSSLLRPFCECDMSTLKLESEDDNQWVFSAQRKAPRQKSFRFIQLTIAKGDGILREERLWNDTNKSKSIRRVEDLVLNPDLPDEVFRFSPPEGTQMLNDDQFMELVIKDQLRGQR
jgi:outer membrane lipoprotein-sorting protein